MKITLHLQKVADFYYGFTRNGNGADVGQSGQWEVLWFIESKDSD